MENNVEFFFAPSLPDCSLGNGQKLNKNGIKRENSHREILQREISQKEFEQNCNIDAQMERNRKIDSQLNFAEKQGNRGEMIALEMIKQDMKKELHKDLSAQVEEEPLKKIGKNFFSKQNENVVEKKILQQNIQIFLNRFVQEEQKNTIFEDRLEKIGSCFKSSAQAAILAGGHKKTWNAIANAGSSLLSVAKDFSILNNVDNLLDFGLGYWSIATKAFSLVVSIFGDDSDDEAQDNWRQEMFVMLQEIYQVFVKGFEQMQSILLDVVCKRLSKICLKLDRIESIMCLSFREMHRKDLLELLDTIKKEASGEISLTYKKKQKILDKLSTWIDIHCFSTIETMQNRTELYSTNVFEEIVDEKAPENAITFLFSLLSQLVPTFKPIYIVPNWELYQFCCKIFAITAEKWKIDNMNLNQRILKTLENFQANVQLVDQNVLNCLKRQWKHHRFLLGRALANAKLEFGGEKTMQQKIDALSIGDQETINQCLEEIELRRLLLSSLERIVPNKNNYKFQLQSKKEFLHSKTSNHLWKTTPNTTNKDPFDATISGDNMKLQEYLNQGLDINLHDGWGHLLLRYVRNSNHCAQGLHFLLKCPGIDINSGAKYNLQDTWPVGSRPIQYILNCCKWQSAILFVANGYDIDANNYGAAWNGNHWGDCGNLHSWATEDAIICLQFVFAMQDPKSPFFREKLRVAYKYYKNYEAGLFVCQLEDSHKEALLCLVIILGLVPDGLQIKDIDRKKKILPCNFTWSQMMKQCKFSNTASIEKEPKESESSVFLKQISIQKESFSSIKNTQKDEICVEKEMFLEILTPFATTEKLQSILQKIHESKKQEDFLYYLNILNLNLKSSCKDYQFGCNVDIFLQQKFCI